MRPEGTLDFPCLFRTALFYHQHPAFCARLNFPKSYPPFEPQDPRNQTADGGLATENEFSTAKYANYANKTGKPNYAFFAHVAWPARDDFRSRLKDLLWSGLPFVACKNSGSRGENWKSPLTLAGKGA
jgi:hypothetical protein